MAEEYEEEEEEEEEEEAEEEEEMEVEYNSDNSSISSSVIQRSLIPDGLNLVLSVASVPLKELGVTVDREEDPTILKELTAEIIGIPKQSFLDETQYQRLKSSLTNGDFWDRIYRFHPV